MLVASPLSAFDFDAQPVISGQTLDVNDLEATDLDGDGDDEDRST